jgi:hypothetical protein
MEAALVVAKERGGGVLERWAGGFWTYPGCDVQRSTSAYRLPAWYVGANTVQALVSRGVMRTTDRLASGAPARVEVVQ